MTDNLEQCDRVMPNSKQLMLNAFNAKTVVPAFNIPYLPMAAPIAKALKDSNAFGFIAVGRADWKYFRAGGQIDAYEEYCKYHDDSYMRLHHDHVPVVDENNMRVDYLGILKKAIDLGFDSIMVDGSRLPLEENIAVTKEIIVLAANKEIAVEAELGSVLGLEAGHLPPYEELFNSGKGFTCIDEASRYVQETGVDWLSVAIGNIHGAIQGISKNSKKVHARLNIEHLAKLREATKIPMVLHGGSGIERHFLQEAIANGIVKINIGTELRLPYEQALKEGKNVEDARTIVHERVCYLLNNVLQVLDSKRVINPG